MTIDPLVLMTDVEAATATLLSAVEGLGDDAVGEPSLLPGWTAGHVLTHLARNADALTNALTWARTGVETPLYPSVEARAAAIEEGAGRPVAEQVADLRAAHERFADAAAAMPAEAWTFHLPPLKRSAAVVPWVRLREVEVHHVDLGRDYTPVDWPDAFALRLLYEIAGDPPEGTPAMVLRPAGVEHATVIGSADGPVITGTAKSIAAWLTGRADGADLTVTPDGDLPQPARWR
ncbi:MULTISPECIES: maleylpyruvate isomerase family mycothiol-dependent enzyme [Actinoplanes]|uniref:maleylpyruvate isomerase family mycothiol-dependent enzyme n=1 Tax=Actinoplanes TaxID=1865 RepID=UPI0005F29784|nr:MULTISPECIES: maleylpyruvate isomerase family mycothiol-dependent enzyme [Actinoplanes]GLY01995.1 maleylpyruvate isomerase [Actinoplanes sp. NBRC 101535]